MTTIDALKNALAALEKPLEWARTSAHVGEWKRCRACEAVGNPVEHKADCWAVVVSKALRDLAEAAPLEADEELVKAAALATKGNEWPHDVARAVLRLIGEKLGAR